MTTREWLLNKMQNMSDEEIAEKFADDRCFICNFRGNCGGKSCKDGIEAWLKQEHKEKITLSEAERIILENIDKDYKWIARDEGGRIDIYVDKPTKSRDSWGSLYWDLRQRAWRGHITCYDLA